MTKLNIIKPTALHRGDVIGIISPASPVSSDEKIEKGVQYLEQLGYRVKLGKHVRDTHGYLAGTDLHRAHDINSMFNDKQVKAIFCMRGGYGSPRLLPFINYKLIKQNPKIFVGYSDITALQLAIFKKTNLVTFSGPMVGVEMWNSFDSTTEGIFWTMLLSTKKFGILNREALNKTLPIRRGRETGIILGGNTSLIASICGTQFLPSFKDSILFLEEVDEQNYRLDRLLNQISLNNVFEDSKGIVIGQLTDIMQKDLTQPFLTVEEILDGYFGKLKKPVLTNFSYGHVPKKYTLPFGITARIDSGKNQIEILEGAVS
ncbi:MAG: LD-carboxypeptidase [Bacteroidetes bacterium]|nr:LD-carboxypeptidase [Bacteroidota bacterium]